MLGHSYRFTAKNECGQTIAIAGVTVKGRRWKFASTGALTFESSEGALMSNAGTLANAAYVSSSTIDNSTDKWMGGDFELTIVAPASASGNVILYFETSTDGGTTFDTNGEGRIVKVVNFTAEATKVVSFSL